MMLVLCLLSSVAFAAAIPNSRIVNGQDADIAEYPWQVSLQSGGSHFCGGSIIGANHVFSAAHCVQSQLVGCKVVAGSSKLSTAAATGQIINMASWLGHPSYDSNTIDYDYSIITLGSTLDLSQSTVAIIATAEQGATYEAGREAITTGWGLTSKPGGSIPDHLQVTVLPLRAPAYCPWSLTNQMICAGGDGSTSCNGDSGGPLVVVTEGVATPTVADYTLIGAVSYGSLSCGVGNPVVYARVAAVRTWIDTNTK